MEPSKSIKNEIAIAAITRKGVALGYRLRQQLPDSHLYLPERFAVEKGVNVFTFKPPAKKVVQGLFARYSYLVLIMAVGAAVRLLATELRSKFQDPGVVVVDETGTFAISLLSGHVGGANELAVKVAHLLNAQPVITTASEVSSSISVDILGKEFGWELEDRDNLTRVAAALVNGDKVGVYQDSGERDWWGKNKSLPENVHLFTNIESLKESDCRAAIIISDRILIEKDRLPGDYTLIYRPRSLIIGIGVNRGTGSKEIEKAVVRLFTEHGLAIKSIRNIATIDLKKNESGLLEFAEKHNLPIEHFDKEALSRVKVPSGPSAVVNRHVGTPAVCEPAVILSSGSSSVLVPKTSYSRAVSISIARLPFDSQKSPRNGRLFLVGLGPGGPEHMTFRAREVLRDCEVVVGYKSYIRLVEPLIADKEVITTGMTEEVQRAKTALELVRAGRQVSVICSGDSGVYGMAGLVGEILREQGDSLDIEVVPGVPALVASAAVLGAPVTGDFASISLSDYLVPWQEIERRLKMAAQADFVIVVYNPKSRRRQRHIVEAREVILRYRQPTTPVGIVRNACRKGQEMIITDLQHLLDYEIDMNTTIIVGNSSTFTFGKWMVTPRGYLNKYSLDS